MLIRGHTRRGWGASKGLSNKSYISAFSETNYGAHVRFLNSASKECLVFDRGRWEEGRRVREAPEEGTREHSNPEHDQSPGVRHEMGPGASPFGLEIVCIVFYLFNKHIST